MAMSCFGGSQVDEDEPVQLVASLVASGGIPPVYATRGYTIAWTYHFGVTKYWKPTFGMFEFHIAVLYIYGE